MTADPSASLRDDNKKTNDGSKTNNGSESLMSTMPI